MAGVASIIQSLLWIFSLAIFGRAIMSWISPKGSDPVSLILYQITEPVLAPIRRVMPRTGTFDLTPMAVLILINFVLIPVVRKLG